MQFDGGSKQWPNFIQNFKYRVHNKISFSASVCKLFIKCIRRRGEESRKRDKTRWIFLCRSIENFKTGIW